MVTEITPLRGADVQRAAEHAASTVRSAHDSFTGPPASGNPLVLRLGNAFVRFQDFANTAAAVVSIAADHLNRPAAEIDVSGLRSLLNQTSDAAIESAATCRALALAVRYTDSGSGKFAPRLSQALDFAAANGLSADIQAAVVGINLVSAPYTTRESPRPRSSRSLARDNDDEESDGSRGNREWQRNSWNSSRNGWRREGKGGKSFKDRGHSSGKGGKGSWYYAKEESATQVYPGWTLLLSEDRGEHWVRDRDRDSKGVSRDVDSGRADP